MAAAIRSFCKLFSVLIHHPLFLLLLTLSALFSLPFPVCLSSASRILSGLMKCIIIVSLGLGENFWCLKWIDCLWLIFMVRVWRMYRQRGDGMWWRHKRGSNTAITTQLISIGVTERISVTPSMFTHPGRESSSEKDKEREREKASNSPFNRSLIRMFI